METRLFLDSVLGGEGRYCLFGARKSAPRIVQNFYSSVGELLQAADELNAINYDTYFALGTFDENDSRKATNVLSLSSLFLDLDCGPSKDYATQKDAIIGLQSFCKKLSLPKPTVVNSGRGIHVYWALHEPITPEEWLPVAQCLKSACSLHGLRADPAVTADVARVLRVPNTHNYKTDPPSEVVCMTMGEPVNLDVFYELLGGEELTPPTEIVSSPEDKYAHLESSFKDVLVKSSKGNGCEQIRIALTDKDNVSEPTWRGILSILKASVDGSRDKAHAISKGYSGYSEYETNAKWDNLSPSMPYSCVKFNEHNPDICLKCPHWLKVGSPITLGNRTKEASETTVEAPAASIPTSPITTYTIPVYPKPYFRGVNGGVYLRTTDREGDPIEVNIYHNDLYVVKRINDVETGESIVLRLHLPKDGVKEFTMPLTAVTAKEEFRKQMSMMGVALMRMDDLMQYITTWVNELQASGGATMAHKQFGWVGEDCKSFILGNQEIFADRIEFNPPSNQTIGLMPAFEPKGTLEGWKETINFYNREGFELHQYVVGAGFGSILMKFMGEISCAALHLHSKESGVGKTTALLAALSIWGRPDELLLQERDTYNSKMNRGEVMHNLPLCMDELTNSSGKQLSDIAYQFTSGKQRMRMSGGSNAERYRGEPWNLIAITTGNTSMVELIGTYKSMPKAEAQRIFEVKVKRIFNSSNDKGMTDEFARNLLANCGWAGVIFVQHILNNLDAVKNLIAQVQERVDKRANLVAENRFWSAQVTGSICGLILARQAGLLDFSIEPVFNWAIEEAKGNKLRSDDMSSSAQQILNDYINEHWGNVLWIKSTDDARSKDGTDPLVIAESMPKGKLIARYEVDTKKVYLVPKPLKEWCGKQQINYESLIEDFINDMEGVRGNTRLSKGTHVVLPKSRVIIVKCDLDVKNR